MLRRPCEVLLLWCEALLLWCEALLLWCEALLLWCEALLLRCEALLLRCEALLRWCEALLLWCEVELRWCEQPTHPRLCLQHLAMRWMKVTVPLVIRLALPFATSLPYFASVCDITMLVCFSLRHHCVSS